MPLSRRRAIRTLAAVSILALAAGSAACSAGGDTKTVLFNFSKREAITYVTQVVADFNASQDEYNVVMDTSGREVVAAGFVRGNPFDLLLTTTTTRSPASSADARSPTSPTPSRRAPSDPISSLCSTSTASARGPPPRCRSRSCRHR